MPVAIEFAPVPTMLIAATRK